MNKPKTEMFETFAIQGMTLHDYFAAKAMQGLLSTTKDEQWIPNDVAAISYLVADAMMKAREGK